MNIYEIIKCNVDVSGTHFQFVLLCYAVAPSVDHVHV